MNNQNKLITLNENEITETSAGAVIALLKAAALTAGGVALGYGAVVVTSNIGQSIYNKVTD